MPGSSEQWDTEMYLAVRAVEEVHWINVGVGSENNNSYSVPLHPKLCAKCSVQVISFFLMAIITSYHFLKSTQKSKRD